MPRTQDRWNEIPLKIVMNEVDDEDVETILRTLGITPFGREFGQSGDHQGWQTVSLPKGWHILLENGRPLLLDEREQLRGRILDALRPNHYMPGTHADGRLKRWRFKPPVLRLQYALTQWTGFSAGEDESYTTRSQWIENPYGERLYGEYEVRIPKETREASLKELQKKINDWLEEHYPDWKNPSAYWNMFN